MSLFFVIKPSNSYNNPPIKIPSKNYCYSYKTETGRIAVLNPVIDKISLTYSVDEKTAQDSILQGLQFSVKDESFKEYAHWAAPSVPYKFKARVTPPDLDSQIFVFADPKKKDIRFLKFEFNPAQLGSDGIDFFKETMLPEILLDELATETFLAEAYVPRLDIACDLVNLGMSNLLVESSISGKTHAYFGLDGMLETSYLGAGTKGNSNTKFYNKTQELLDGGKPAAYGGAEVIRVERTIATKLKLADLHKLKNPFKVLDFFIPETVHYPESEHHWMMFLDSCKYRGEAGALAQIPEGLRKAYEEELKQAKKSIWKPDQIWKNWERALEDTGLISL